MYMSNVSVDEIMDSYSDIKQELSIIIKENWNYFHLLSSAEVQFIVDSFNTQFVELYKKLKENKVEVPNSGRKIIFGQSSVKELNKELTKDKIQKKFLSVVKEIKYFPLQSYQNLFYLSLQKYFGYLKENYQKKDRDFEFYIFPAGVPSQNYSNDDEQKIKSYQTVMYMFNGNFFRHVFYNFFGNYNYKVTLVGDFNFEYIDLNKQILDSKLILFVDDFVGSGKSAERSICFWEKKLDLVFKDMEWGLLSLVAIKEEYTEICDLKHTFFGEIVKEVSDDNIRGYGSEQQNVLVAMERTPNNSIAFLSGGVLNNLYFDKLPPKTKLMGPFVRNYRNFN